MMEQINMKNMGRYLYDLRLRSHFTLQEAADHMDINKSTLFRYEQGIIHNMSDKVRCGILRTYGITEEELEEQRYPEEITDTDPVSFPEEPWLEEDQFLTIYRSLDVKAQHRIQFLLLNSIK